MSEDIEHYRNQLSAARTEIKNLRQQIYGLKHEYQKEVKEIKSMLNNLRCANCAEAASTVISNESQPSSSDRRESITYRPIGVIETAFHNKRGVPRQPTVLNQAGGTVIINNVFFNNPDHALDGLEEFSHMWIIFHFHVSESTSFSAKVAPPRLRGERRGVYSTRSPHRPCQIGLSLVKIQRIEGNKIHFLGVDMVSGTPVLDIKPYIPQYDYPTPAGTPVRPTTMGVSDTNSGIGDSLAAQLERMNPLTSSIRVDNNIPSPQSDAVPSPEMPQTLTPGSSSATNESVTVNVASRQRDIERGAPDGQERFTPPQSTAVMNIMHDGIRIAPWITNPPSQTYRVNFTDEALARLFQLIGDRAPAFKSNIESLLSEDPRSAYVRTRYADSEYCCALEDLSISCIFDSNSYVCTIVAVRSAEDLQNQSIHSQQQ